jgi:hypothetical protein
MFVVFLWFGDALTLYRQERKKEKLQTSNFD